MARTLFFGNRALGIGIGVAVVVALLLAFLSGGGPQAEIEEKLERLALAGDIVASDPRHARMLELRNAANGLLAKDVVVRVGDREGDYNGRPAVLSRLEEVVMSVREMRVTLRGLSITQSGHAGDERESWEARFLLDAEGSGLYGSLRDSRRVIAHFEELDGEWMLTFADVSARDDAHPEARP